MIGDPLEREQEILGRLRADPTIVDRLPQDAVIEFAQTRQALQLSIIARDPLGMGGPQPLTREQEALARAYEQALDELDRLTLSVE